MVRVGSTSLQFMWELPTAAYAATYMIWRSMEETVSIVSLSMCRFMDEGCFPRKLSLPTWLLVLDSDKYDASEWVLRCMSLFLYWTTASG